MRPPLARPVRFLRGLLLAALAAPSPMNASAIASISPRHLDLHFVRNEGQADSEVAFTASTFAGAVYVTRDGRIVHSLIRRGAPGWTLTERLVDGRAVPAAEDCSAARASFFLGDDPKRWRDGVETSESVSLGEAWPGVRVDLRSRERNVEKVFTLAPGADPEDIRVRLEGARSLSVDGAGALVADTGLGPVVFSPPFAYQVRGEGREPVPAAYVVRSGEYGFRLGPHDPALPVVIDPILQSTYVGGSGTLDQVDEIAFHPTSGNVYAAGYTNSGVFPGTTGGAQASYGGGNDDAFVAVFSSDLTTLVQATYLGGGGYDIAEGLTISADGNSIYVVGETASANFPISGGAQPSNAGGSDAWVVRLDPSLTGAFKSTYLGGTANDHGSRSIAVDGATGSVLVGGWGESKTFPTPTVAVPAGGAQTTFSSSFSGWVVRLSGDLATVEQRTFVGEATQLFTLVLSSAGVYVAGHNGTPPALTGGAQTVAGGTDAFVTLINTGLTSFVRSTYFGGEALDTCFGIAVNAGTGDVYLSGGTASLSLPGTLGGAQPVRRGPTDNYVARIKGNLQQILGASYYGGTGAEGSNAVAVNPDTGDVYIAGITTSTRMPATTSGAQRIYADGGGDAFVARFNAALTKVLGATFLGGGPDPGQPNNSGFDESTTVQYNAAEEEVVTAGYTASSDLPKTAGGAQPARGGVLNDTGADGFVTRLSPDLLALFAPVSIAVDPAAGAGSDGNGLLEPGETVSARPTWKNQSAGTVSLSGAASAFTGPPGATYTLTDAAAAYGSIAAGASNSCASVPNCFSLSVSNPATRPASHWDVTFVETPSPADAPMQWTLHVGNSFTDVPRSYPFYRAIETLFHNGVTLGCTATAFCLSDPVPRINMAIFIARAIAGGAGNLPDRGQAAGAPYSCTFANGVSLFADIAPTDQGCPAAHYLLALNVANGCSPTAFCGAPNVTRGEMSIFMARGVVAPGGGAAIPNTYGPDPATGRSYSCAAGSPNLHFTDVFTTDLFCKHVHYLWARGIIDGCGGTLYCPAALVTRDAMAKFLSNSFALPLYAP